MIRLSRQKYIKKIGVYTIVCTPNKYVYVGSSNNLYSRINSHKNRLFKNEHVNPLLQNCFNKYGERNFKVSIVKLLPIGSTTKDILKAEQDEYNKISINSFCMNASSNVSYVNDKRFREKSAESIKNMWSTNYDEAKKVVCKNLIKAQKSYRDLLDKGVLKMISPMKGKRHSAKSKELQRASAIKARKISLNARTVPIYSVSETGIITKYSSARDALRSMNIENNKLASNITACCRGKRAKAFNMSWKYYE